MDFLFFLIGFVLGGSFVGGTFYFLSKKNKNEFDYLANSLIQEKIKIFKSESQEEISQVLSPLKEKIESFEKKVEETFIEESKDRHLLKNQIEALNKAHVEISQDAKNLTDALKGNSKSVGDYGEIILERLLENSGLTEGQEYITQGKGMALRNDEGKLQKPDVIITLPNHRHIIIDSKMSLKSYEAYLSASDDEKPINLKDFNTSVKKHIDDLSTKSYESLEDLNSLQFVILFIPLEGAFQLLLKESSQLFEYSYEKNVILTGPSSLLFSLKTIASLWSQEKQSKNAKDIARRAGLLFDKFQVFYRDLKGINDHFKKTQDLFEASFNRLQDGSGSILTRIEELKKLGGDP